MSSQWDPCHLLHNTLQWKRHSLLQREQSEEHGRHARALQTPRDRQRPRHHWSGVCANCQCWRSFALSVAHRRVSNKAVWWQRQILFPQWTMAIVSYPLCCNFEASGSCCLDPHSLCSHSQNMDDMWFSVSDSSNSSLVLRLCHSPYQVARVTWELEKLQKTQDTPTRSEMTSLRYKSGTSTWCNWMHSSEWPQTNRGSRVPGSNGTPGRAAATYGF